MRPQARGLKNQWQNTASQLQPHVFMYANQLPMFDSICGTYRLHPTENAFYEPLDHGTVLRYELTTDGRLFEFAEAMNRSKQSRNDCDCNKRCLKLELQIRFRALRTHLNSQKQITFR